MQVGDSAENTCLSSAAVSNIAERPVSEANSDNYSRADIKIRSRLPREQHKSENSVVQGTAARRIRLQVNRKPDYVCDDEATSAPSAPSEVRVISCKLFLLVS